MKNATREDISDEAGPDARIRAVDRVCDILDVVAAREPISLAEVAAACDLPKTSAFRYLATLEARRYVDRVGETAEYRLGLAMMNFQSNYFDSLIEVATPLLTQIRDEFGETANLGVLTGSYVSYLLIVESRKSVRLAARPEDKDSVHCTALGKAIVSRMSDEKVHDLLGNHYERKTYKTLTTWPALQQNLELVRANGFAVDDEENEVGGRCIAVAIPGPFQAAISLSAPVTGLAEKELAAVARKLRAVTDEIAQSLPAT